MVAAAALAALAANGPDPARPETLIEGAIAEVRAFGVGRVAADTAIVRFRLDEAEPAFRYGTNRVNGAQVRLAIERGDAASVELNARGQIVGVSVDGRRLVRPAETAGDLRRVWLIDLMTLSTLIGLYLFMRPAQHRAD
jgi:hypothetical protein